LNSGVAMIRSFDSRGVGAAVWVVVTAGIV
jgi:hypothetical protein